MLIINSINSNTDTRLQEYDWGNSIQLRAGAQSAHGSHPRLSSGYWRLLHQGVNSSFVTTVSQLKMCDFLGDTFKGFEVL